MKIATASQGMATYFKDVFPDLIVLGDGVEIPSELDLIICTGGEDISPELYGEQINGAYGINHKRDKDEMDVLSKIMSTSPGTKILGVCRGLQLINAFFGGTLYQDLYSISLQHKSIHPIDFTNKKHPLSWMTIVNSLHHQAIKTIGTRVMGLPPRIIAVEPSTGIVEAINWGNRVLAVQFHPELFIDDIRDRFFDQIVQWVLGNISIGDDFDKEFKNPWYATTTSGVVVSFDLETWDEYSDPQNSVDDESEDE